ncbi:MAG: hypothetical protein ACLFVU_00830 [Phycisphaerae bacterium]
MTESRKVQVLKRDGSTENFDVSKLAASMWRAMDLADEGRYLDAFELALAVGIYLKKTSRCLTTAALLEMAVKVLRRARFDDAAIAMEEFHGFRLRASLRLRVVHDDGTATLWDKSWLGMVIAKSWGVSRTTGRILAGQIEYELLTADVGQVLRGDLMAMANRRIMSYGLADAVPVR